MIAKDLESAGSLIGEELARQELDLCGGKGGTAGPCPMVGGRERTRMEAQGKMAARDARQALNRQRREAKLPGPPKDLLKQQEGIQDRLKGVEQETKPDPHPLGRRAAELPDQYHDRVKTAAIGMARDTKMDWATRQVAVQDAMAKVEPMLARVRPSGSDIHDAMMTTIEDHAVKAEAALRAARPAQGQGWRKSVVARVKAVEDRRAKDAAMKKDAERKREKMAKERAAGSWGRPAGPWGRAADSGLVFSGQPADRVDTSQS